MKEKFVLLENELRDTRKEVRVLQETREEVGANPPLSFASAVIRSSRGQEVEPGAELVARVGERRWEEQRRLETVGVDVTKGGKEEKVKMICEKARRTIRFKQIDEKDIQRMFGEAMPYGGAKSRDQARNMTVK